MVKFSVTTDIGRVRPSNQDAYCAEVLDTGPGHALLVVADGMGGYSGGEVASALAIQTITGLVRAEAPSWRTGDERITGLRSGVVAAHNQIRQAQVANPQHAEMGTTLTAILVWGELLYLAHSGDSRAYAVQPNGRVRRLSDDHSIVGELVRGGSLTEEEAQFHPQRHILTNVLGLHGPLRVDTLEVTWQPGDMVLLCSDGLTNHVADHEVARAALEPEFATLAARLAELANQRGGHDNVTVVAARWEG